MVRFSNISIQQMSKSNGCSSSMVQQYKRQDFVSSHPHIMRPRQEKRLRSICLSTDLELINAVRFDELPYKVELTRNRNLQTSKAPLKSQAQGTILFTSAASNQRGCPKNSPWEAQVRLPEGEWRQIIGVKAGVV